MKRALLISLTCLWPFVASADVTKRISTDPLGELNALYGKICQWKDGETIPVTAGPEGLMIGDRLGASGRPRPDDAVVH